MDEEPTEDRARWLVASTIALLRDAGKLVSVCTIQAAVAQRHNVDLTFREIIEARKPQVGTVQTAA